MRLSTAGSAIPGVSTSVPAEACQFTDLFYRSHSIGQTVLPRWSTSSPRACGSCTQPAGILVVRGADWSNLSGSNARATHERACSRKRKGIRVTDFERTQREISKEAMNQGGQEWELNHTETLSGKAEFLTTEDADFTDKAGEFPPQRGEARRKQGPDF